MSKKEIIFEINGFQLKTNSIYKVADKFDSEAPSGFVEEGVTKLPSDGVGNTVFCRYININPNNPEDGIWDTGFYRESPMYEDLDDSKISEQVERLQKYIVQPYTKKYGAKYDLDHNDDNFWNNKSVFLTSKKVFNTAKIDDLLELYIALISYSLTPKGSEGDPAYSGSDYIIVDNEKNIEFKKNKAGDEMDAIINFGKVLDESKAKLLKVLLFVGLNVSDKMDSDDLKYTFIEYIKGSNINAETFNKLVESLSDSKVEDKINMFKSLTDLYKNGTSVVKKPNGKFYFKDIEIGESLKNASENIIYSKELEGVKKEIFMM